MSAVLHIALNVEDLHRSVSFYEALFGVAPDKVAQGYARFRTDDPALVLALNEQEKVRRGARLSHFGVKLSTQQQLEAAEARLRPAGLIRKTQRETKCCHAVQNKIWARDPEGNDWEFYVVVEDLQPVGSSPEEGEAS